MKRFWTNAAAMPAEPGWTVALDGKPVRTPARAALALPTTALAEAIAAEWNAIEGDLAPRALPLTGLANAALDRAGPELADSLAAYAQSDLLCYRAEHPPALVQSQAAAWDPPLAWARARYDVAFTVAEGIAHRPQPAPTLARLRAAVHATGPFERAGLHPIVTITGSLVLGLAVLDGALTPEQAFDAGEHDALWQARHWGEDADAAATRALRRADLMIAARFLSLLR